MRNRFRRGDRDALGELYDEHAQVLYRYALRVTGDWAEAEDVVSTTFLEAWRGREKLHPEGDSLRPWLLGIATNIMRGNARARRRREIALARVPERGSIPDFADDLVTHLEDAEKLRAAHAALARLRRRDREVFTLVVWAGLDYAAAAEALGVPVGTVRSRLSRARTRLRELAETPARTTPVTRATQAMEATRAVRVRAGRTPTTHRGEPSAAPDSSVPDRRPVPGRKPAPDHKPVPDRILAARWSTQENHG
ncbi:sigma-70 family RNA polymerase sigma factor [Streptomyces sp. RY43-2]|uniref:Sigma-70 family RNA polymerase sigma factor n=1 Tax=Streptomyces macrolidinus TaxID=2952607 RepID=A0ABT0Z695_9ACTN|nr:sigma-70 family RNA polymerase sigma factor [Streptomyces macrolidinus]MCN9239287.1 sigma-70 family RNA polymerase sigma factor [Streptomyces macrolidinus]